MDCARKSRVIFLNLVFTLGLAFGLTSCASLTGDLLKDPEVQVMNVALKGLTMQDAMVDLKLNVKNPNIFALNLSKIKYALQLSGEQLTEGVFEQGANIPANGEASLVVPLKLKFNALNNLYAGFVKKTLTRKYTLSGAVDLGPFSIPFKQDGEINLDQISK